jgi:hypothetical protein
MVSRGTGQDKRAIAWIVPNSQVYAYSNLSFGTESQFTDTCTQHYHWLRDFALDHDEAGDIFRAVD